MSVDNEHINKKNFLVKKKKGQSHVAFPSSPTELPETGMEHEKTNI